MSDLKKRHWAFVAYPESLPENWVDIIQKIGIPFAISPLHDKDINPTGDLKKPHYHVIVSYPGPARLSQVKTITEALNQPNPIPLEAVEGYYRYLTHRDNPEKAQYLEMDIRCLNGFEAPLESPSLVRKRKLECTIKIQEIIEENDITEFWILVQYLMRFDLELYEVAAVTNSIGIKAMLSSRRAIKSEK